MPIPEQPPTEAIALQRLRLSMLECQRCPALVRSRSRVVPGDGEAPAAVAFVGLAPGRFGGDRTGIPFSGDRSGDLLRRMIGAAGLKGVFITNLVRCGPRDHKGRNRDPSAREIFNCRGHLTAELTIARPRIVVCLGRVAWRELAGRTTPFEPNRAVVTVANGLRLYPMYHPGYVIRGKYPLKKYERDFRDLAVLIDSTQIGRNAHRRWMSRSNSSAKVSNAPTTLPMHAWKPPSSLRSRSTSRF